MTTLPLRIENGHGEAIVFERCVAPPTGERFELRNEVQPGAGPPMHVHYWQEEGFTVREGRLGYQRLGEPARFAGPGESVTFKAGEAHRFWNAGDGALRCAAYLEPADNIEYFLTEVFESTKRNGGRPPHPLDVAFLLTHFRSEFAMLAVPAAVQRFVFPLLVAAGRLTGRYRRYADAPAPVRRGAAADDRVRP